MSGDIQDMPVRRCPVCGAVFVEDSRIFRDPDRCPVCGALLKEK